MRCRLGRLGKEQIEEAGESMRRLLCALRRSGVGEVCPNLFLDRVNFLVNDRDVLANARERQQVETAGADDFGRTFLEI